MRLPKPTAGDLHCMDIVTQLGREYDGCWASSKTRKEMKGLLLKEMEWGKGG